jgi:hypothetical protein
MKRVSDIFIVGVRALRHAHVAWIAATNASGVAHPPQQPAPPE